MKIFQFWENIPPYHKRKMLQDRDDYAKAF